MGKPRPTGESWEWQQQPAKKTSGGGRLYVVFLLVSLVVIALSGTGFVLARVLRSDGRPVALPGPATGTISPPPGATATRVEEPTGSPGSVQIRIDPQEGYINTLVRVTGQGWWPGEPVFVFLRSPAGAEGQGYAYAAAVADDDGNFRAAFTFPNEMRWMNQAWAEVLARGTRSQQESAARFALIVPTPTPTIPPPTAPPTRVATDTAVPTSTVLPTMTPTPTPALITEWRAEYFANPGLGGDPALVRNDVAIDFDWDTGSPDPRIPADGFSARWTRQIEFLEGHYRFLLSSDDGMRFWVDGQLLLDEWHDGIIVNQEVDVYLAGGWHDLRLEYYENIGKAMIRLRWSQGPPPTPSPTPTWTSTPSATPTWTSTPTATPTSSPTRALTPTASPIPLPTSEPTGTAVPTSSPPSRPVLPLRWQGESSANATLDGSRLLQRQDSELLFDWLESFVDPCLSAEGLSVQWTSDFWLR